MQFHHPNVPNMLVYSQSLRAYFVCGFCILLLYWLCAAVPQLHLQLFLSPVFDRGFELRPYRFGPLDIAPLGGYQVRVTGLVLYFFHILSSVGPFFRLSVDFQSPSTSYLPHPSKEPSTMFGPKLGCPRRFFLCFFVFVFVFVFFFVFCFISP
jgi:hypothetical protein